MQLRIRHGIYLLRSNHGARNGANDFFTVSTKKPSRRDPENSVVNPDPDPHQSDKLDPDLHYLQMTSQNVSNMNLFEHFFTGLSLYLEARFWIRVLTTVKSRIRIHMRIK
jgi:hypothetical protein